MCLYIYTHTYLFVPRNNMLAPSVVSTLTPTQPNTTTTTHPQKQGPIRPSLPGVHAAAAAAARTTTRKRKRRQRRMQQHHHQHQPQQEATGDDNDNDGRRRRHNEQKRERGGRGGCGCGCRCDDGLGPCGHPPPVPRSFALGARAGGAVCARVSGDVIRRWACVCAIVVECNPPPVPNIDIYTHPLL